LCAVLDEISELQRALRVPVWLWPDGLAPVPIRIDNPTTWLRPLAAERAVCRDRSGWSRADRVRTR
jgi:hypothetical protein